MDIQTTFAKDFSRLLRSHGIKARAVRNNNYGDYTAVYADENFNDAGFTKAREEFVAIHGELPIFSVYKKN